MWKAVKTDVKIIDYSFLHESGIKKKKKIIVQIILFLFSL